MKSLIDKKILNSIVCVNKFNLNFKSVDLDILCIEGEDTEVNYRFELQDISYFFFRQENNENEFSVIDTFFEKFNECEDVSIMHSEAMEDFWVLSFHSGIHHMIIGFRKIGLFKL
ncbi:hypothetical protein ACFE6N_22980 [Pedobacter sp. BG31]|uniref:hypothetical protein n=1 Tax=Pedobacter sp. BG31 TaxID=3349697 RepID=UPI0035F29DC3